MHPTARAFFSGMIWCAPKSPWAPSAAPARMPAAPPLRSRRHPGGAGARVRTTPHPYPPAARGRPKPHKTCRSARRERVEKRAGRGPPSSLARSRRGRHGAARRMQCQRLASALARLVLGLYALSASLVPRSDSVTKPGTRALADACRNSCYVSQDVFGGCLIAGRVVTHSGTGLKRD